MSDNGADNDQGLSSAEERDAEHVALRLLEAGNLKAARQHLKSGPLREDLDRASRLGPIAWITFVLVLALVVIAFFL